MGRQDVQILRSISTADYGDVSIEYSIALEYTGPPPVERRHIPRAVPLDFHQIPTAEVASSAAMMDNLAFPVVHPIASRDNKSASDRNYELRSCRCGGDANDRNLGSDGNSEVGTSNQTNGKYLPRTSDGSSSVKPLDGTESSGTLGFSDSRDHSRELSGSSDMLETPIDCEEIQAFRRYLDPTNWNPTPTQPFSVEVSTDEEGSDNGDLQHRNRRSTVTFEVPESTALVEEDYEDEDGGGRGEDDSSMSVGVRERRPVPKRTIVKKGLCYRCLKGNRFTEKLACVVCDAKYCSNCVLRAMGSMPEGRKCVACIRYPIDESKRKMLGRGSKLLRKLLSKEEVEQILQSEVSCEANQIPPELIFVNKQPLSQEELSSLLSCLVPPRSLNPGSYWYDRVSGFWGKEGHKACQIISPDLLVRGGLWREASNGDTNVLINGREITKVEHLMLQVAGVRCDGYASLWVNADGSYSEEGMNFVKGNIWAKKRTKALCTVLSLPTPESSHSIGDADPNGHPKYFEQLPLHKLLLVGNDQSGTSTIYKQARVLYDLPFSEEERENIKLMIQSKLYGYLAIVLEAREQFEEESLLEKRRRSADQPGPSDRSNEDHEEKTIYSINSRLKSFSEWLITIMVSGNLDTIFPAATREYSTYVEELWKSAAFQATYSRRNELELPRVANYFLDKAVEIAKVDYDPSDTDILYAEGLTSSNGLAHMEFSFPKTLHDDDSMDQQSHMARYQLIRAHANSLGVNCKWMEMFEDVDMVLLCISLTDYDEYELDDSGALVNKMILRRRFFESLVRHPSFEGMSFVLILNKLDLMEEKIERSPLTQCQWFEDFNPVISRHQGSSNPNHVPSLAQWAFHYVAVKFKRLFKSLTGRKLYVCPVTALESDMVDGALRYAREILKWEQEKFDSNLGLNEISSESIEPSTS